MAWKMNYLGEYEHQISDPEKIQEMDPPILQVFGVTISSRYGQVHEIVEMLTFVHSLYLKDPQTLWTIEAIDWDSKGCMVSISLKEGKIPPPDSNGRKLYCDEIAQHYLSLHPGAQIMVSGSNDLYMRDD